MITKPAKDYSTDIIHFKKPSFPKLKCRFKLFKGNENADSYYFLNSEFYLELSSATPTTDEMRNMTYFDCSQAIRTSFVKHLSLPEIDCSPCTLSLEVVEQRTQKTF